MYSRKPLAATVRSYPPATRPGNVYKPSCPVVAFTTAEVASDRRLNSTPGIAAPVGSWTSPVMVALVPCAHITLASAVHRTNAAIIRPHGLNIQTSPVTCEDMHSRSSRQVLSLSGNLISSHIIVNPFHSDGRSTASDPLQSVSARFSMECATFNTVESPGCAAEGVLSLRQPSAVARPGVPVVRL